MRACSCAGAPATLGVGCAAGVPGDLLGAAADEVDLGGAGSPVQEARRVAATAVAASTARGRGRVGPRLTGPP
ncbi:hypothetical protein IDVR_06460 [Intrasporangium sp. DVR]